MLMRGYQDVSGPTVGELSFGRSLGKLKAILASYRMHCPRGTIHQLPTFDLIAILVVSPATLAPRHPRHICGHPDSAGLHRDVRSHRVSHDWGLIPDALADTGGPVLPRMGVALVPLGTVGGGRGPTYGDS